MQGTDRKGIQDDSRHKAKRNPFFGLLMKGCLHPKHGCFQSILVNRKLLDLQTIMF